MLELKVGVHDGGILRRQVHLLYRCVRALTVCCGSVGSFGRSAFVHEGKIRTRTKCVFHFLGAKARCFAINTSDESWPMCGTIGCERGEEVTMTAASFFGKRLVDSFSDAIKMKNQHSNRLGCWSRCHS